MPQQQQLVTSQQVTRFFEDNPKASMAAAAAHFGVSKATINNRMQQGAGGRVLRLTPLDRRVFQFIIDYTVENGWPPSTSDITETVGCARSAAHACIHRLAAYGVIVLGDGARTIRVVGSRIDMKGVDREPA